MQRLRSVARWLDDLVSLWFRWILMTFNLLTALPVCYGVSFLNNPLLLSVTVGLFTLFELVIYLFVTRMPTAAEHKAFINAYLQGPFNERFKCPKVKQGSRVKQLASVVNSLPNWQPS
jgi:hypothetical protein